MSSDLVPYEGRGRRHDRGSVVRRRDPLPVVEVPRFPQRLLPAEVAKVVEAQPDLRSGNLEYWYREGLAATERERRQVAPAVPRSGFVSDPTSYLPPRVRRLPCCPGWYLVLLLFVLPLISGAAALSVVIPVMLLAAIGAPLILTLGIAAFIASSIPA